MKEPTQSLSGFLVVLGFLSCTPFPVPQMTGQFIPAGTMMTARMWHTATLLHTERVLVTGGIAPGSNAGIVSAELYDPASNAFVVTGSLTTGRTFHSSTLLVDGDVLIAGGRGLGPESLSTAERYHPATGTFTRTGDMTVAHAGHTATLLNNGRVLIVGGFNSGAKAEVYDPLTETFTATDDMTVGLFGSGATLLPDGNVLISTAYNAGGPYGTSGPGGIGELGVYGELYDSPSGRFSKLGAIPLWYFYWHTASLLKNGKILIAGGADADNGFALASAGIYDPDQRNFVGTGKMTRYRHTHTATALLDNTVLVTGGFGECCTDTTLSAELYNPVEGTFTSTGDMYVARAGHTATALNNGQVLIAGGSMNAMAELYLPRMPVAAPVITGLRFDRTSVAAGSSFNVNIAGSNLIPETFFDVRFRTPASDSYGVVLNWQKGVGATHAVTVGTAPGIWTINGVRAHQTEKDHTGIFYPVSGAITVLP